MPLLEYDTPNRDVTNGERTVDEMMGGYVMHTVDRENAWRELKRYHAKRAPPRFVIWPRSLPTPSAVPRVV